MTDLIEKFNISLNKPGQTDLQSMRDNWKWLFMVAMEKVDAAPDWATTITSNSSPLDFSEPDQKLVSKTYTDESPNRTEQFRYQYTWSGGNKTQIVFQYYDVNSSPQWQTVTGGTATLSYDGSGNLTGVTTA
jgi:hypothetical protein